MVKPNAGPGGRVSKGRMALGRSSAGDDAALRRNAAASARGLLHLSLRFRHRQIVVRLEGRIYSPVSLVLADHGGRTVHARHTARHYRELQEKEIKGLYLLKDRCNGWASC
uniref:Uncharacterized protein n=1 Tax=Anopheles coluzzii TaxID=1518534 RepID=A0A8W7PUS7_ANOCL